jgi:hypothetical protein
MYFLLLSVYWSRHCKGYVGSQVRKCDMMGRHERNISSGIVDDELYWQFYMLQSIYIIKTMFKLQNIDCCYIVSYIVCH